MFTTEFGGAKLMLVAAGVALACTSHADATSSATTPGSPLTAVSWGPNRLDVFGVGISGYHLWHTAWNGSFWQSWDNLGGPGPYIGSVAAVAWGQNRLDIFASVDGGHVWHTAWNGSSWQGWDDRGVPGVGAGQLAAVSWAANRLDVFTVSAGRLWHMAWDGSSWWNWESATPGEALFGVSAVAWGANRLDVFAVGSLTGQVWHIAWNGSFWQPWDDIGSPGLLPSDFFGSVSVVSWQPGRLDLATTQGVDSDAFHTSWNGSSWEQSWDDRGHPMSGPLSSFANVLAVTWGPNRLDLFGVGRNDGHLSHLSWDGTSWQSYWDDRGQPSSGLMECCVSAVSWGAHRLDIFTIGQRDGDLWHTAWNGSFWQGWDNLGKPPEGLQSFAPL